eukprot:scaffold13742_cov157-Amphora_coffeaeformis.AAC.8
MSDEELRKRFKEMGVNEEALLEHLNSGAQGKQKDRDAGMNKFRSEAQGLVNALKVRSEQSFLSKSKDDLSKAPIGVADEFEIGGTKPRVIVSHQGEMKRDNIDKGLFLSDKRKVEYKVDVMASVISEEMMKVLCTVE